MLICLRNVQFFALKPFMDVVHFLMKALKVLNPRATLQLINISAHHQDFHSMIIKESMMKKTHCMTNKQFRQTSQFIITMRGIVNMLRW